MRAPKIELSSAMEKFRQGDADGALRALDHLLSSYGDDAHVWHARGRVLLSQGRNDEAVIAFGRAASSDPGAPLLWFALADAHRAAGDIEQEIASLDRALAIEPYMLPALLRKAQAFEGIGKAAAAATIYRALLKTTPNEEGLPVPVAEALAHGRRVIAQDDARRIDEHGTSLESLLAGHNQDETARVRVFLDGLAGRKIYFPAPTSSLFPFLPAYEYFPRTLFPWFAVLEKAVDDIRAEFLALASGHKQFAPYVQFAPGDPINQWGKLNHSADWGAFFLWRDGLRIDDNCASCPRTAALMARLPLVDVPGLAPTVMFSLLAPHTHIPAHTGVTNTRVTVHLPLIVPPDCKFRVGGETREWREGQAWAFDDTIEHEAWNDSDQPRAILIIDAWNPLLSELERNVVRALARGTI